ncbi:MAG: LCP family protein [Erysipelotrichaceae bacterium]|nr:LCP family protein [Erysipelotrichaceae bacterium]
MKHSKSGNRNLLSIASITLSLLSHIAVIAAIVLSFRYYAIYPSIFVSLVAIVLLLMLILDIVLFVGLNTKDKALKIVVSVLSLMIFLGGTFGSYYLAKVNGVVNNVLDGNSDKYEDVSGVFVSYKKNYASLESMSGAKVGFLNENTEGVASVATNLLDKAKVDYVPLTYNSYKELFQSLLDGDIDVAVMMNGYRTMFENDETLDYSKYLEDMVDNYVFEDSVKVGGSRSSKKINTEPFNVLLIGWSRVELGSSVGLADAIILATINPQTYTVSMMSIARDSFVPISCYGDAYDKINSGRSTSRACFIETVENFINTGIPEDQRITIDFYMEADYEAIVRIVNRIDGIDIYNPVEFELDGVYVPQGYVHADGWQALQFCRERHHMPNGDFDRQQHQKEVILAIARKFIESGDVSMALYAMEGAGKLMSTDLSISQLTSIFNMILNTKNYTGLPTFDLIDFHALRITGYGGIMYYSYAMRLPLWVYLIYQGSFDESMAHVEDVMGRYTTISQTRSLEFSALNPYVRLPFYSTEYEHKFMFEPDPMPPYWATLEGMPYAEAMQWAAENGVGLSVTFITAGDSRYDPTQDGMVVEQTPRHGALISEYPSGSIVVMGTGELDESKQVPNFVGKNYREAVDWGNRYGVYVHKRWDADAKGNPGDVVSQSHSAYTPIEDVNDFTIVIKDSKFEIEFNNNGKGSYKPSDIVVKLSDEETYSFESLGNVAAGAGDAGEVWVFDGWYTSANGGEQITNSSQLSRDTTLYAHWTLTCSHSEASSEVTSDPTCASLGKRHFTCPRCRKEWDEDIPMLDHDYELIEHVDSSCDGDGYDKYRCKNCGNEKTTPIPMLSGSACSPSSSGSGNNGE